MADPKVNIKITSAVNKADLERIKSEYRKSVEDVKGYWKILNEEAKTNAKIQVATINLSSKEIVAIKKQESEILKVETKKLIEADKLEYRKSVDAFRQSEREKREAKRDAERERKSYLGFTGQSVSLFSPEALSQMRGYLRTLDASSPKAIELRGQIDNLAKALSNSGSAAKLSKFQLLEFGENLTVVVAGALTALNGIKSVVSGLISEANKLQSATLGLESISKFKGIDPSVATESVKSLELVKSGLMTVGDASLALKNLLASGFSLEQSIELIKRFGDSAAFGRQSSLEFGYAIVSATEGIKNQNSILVDNAGVTKNLSMILKEAGYSEQDLQKVQSDLNIRTALYNGILKETQGQLGDANKLTKTFQGQQAKLDAQITTIKQNYGLLIQQGLRPFMNALTELDPKLQGAVYGAGTLSSSLLGLLPIISQLKIAFPNLGSSIAGVFGSGGVVVGAIGITIWWLTELGFRISDEIKKVKELEAFNRRIKEGTEPGIINKNAPSEQSLNAFKKQLEKTPEADITVEGNTMKLKDYVKALEDAKNQSLQFGYWNEQFSNQNKEATKNVRMQTEALKEVTEQTGKYKKQLEEFKGAIADRNKLQELYSQSLKKQTELEKEIFPKEKKDARGSRGKAPTEQLKEDLIEIDRLQEALNKLLQEQAIYVSRNLINTNAYLDLIEKIAIAQMKLNSAMRTPGTLGQINISPFGGELGVEGRNFTKIADGNAFDKLLIQMQIDYTEKLNESMYQGVSDVSNVLSGLVTVMNAEQDSFLAKLQNGWNYILSVTQTIAAILSAINTGKSILSFLSLIPGVSTVASVLGGMSGGGDAMTGSNVSKMVGDMSISGGRGGVFSNKIYLAANMPGVEWFEITESQFNQRKLAKQID